MRKAAAKGPAERAGLNGLAGKDWPERTGRKGLAETEPAPLERLLVPGTVQPPRCPVHPCTAISTSEGLLRAYGIAGDSIGRGL